MERTQSVVQNFLFYVSKFSIHAIEHWMGKLFCRASLLIQSKQTNNHNNDSVNEME